MADDLNARVPAAFAARQLGVSRQLIRRWRELGHIQPVGKDGRSPLYRWGDLIATETKLRLSARSSRPAEGSQAA